MLPSQTRVTKKRNTDKIRNGFRMKEKTTKAITTNQRANALKFEDYAGLRTGKFCPLTWSPLMGVPYFPYFP